MFKVYDKVWIIENSKIRKMTVRSVQTQATFGLNGVHTSYELSAFMVAGSTLNGTWKPECLVFATKHKLLESL